MPAIGVSAAGFSIPAFQQVLVNYQTAVLANVNAALDLSDTAPEGQILTILANFDSATYELMEAVYDQYDPDAAEGVGLDNIGAIRGIPRLGATFTQVTIPIGSLALDVAHAPYTGTTVVNGVVTVQGQLLANVVGFPSQTFCNLPTITSGMITGGTNNVAIIFQALVAGPTPTVNPGTLTQITTPVTGWTSITNPLAQSQLGEPEEPDDAYLIRQDEEIGIQGSCNPPAIVAALYQLLATVYGDAGQTGAYSVSFYENTSLQTATVGGTLVLPGKSFSVVIYDPATLLTATEIATVVWNDKPAGIVPVGAQTGLVSDPYLGQQTVAWNVPTGEPLYVSATVAIYPGQVWANVSAAILAALAAAAIAPTPSSGLPPVGQLKPGAPVIGSQLKAVISNVAGVADAEAPTIAGGAATPITFGFGAAPVNTAPLAVDPLSVATVSASQTPTQYIVLTQGIYP